MKTVGYLIIALLIVLQLNSCTEIIDLPLDDGEIKLVVEGTITTDTMAHTIFLTQTTGYYYDQPPPPVTKALVTIDDGEKIVVLTEKMPGVYQTANDFYGVEGKTYTLKIELVSSLNSFKEYSASAYMHHAVTLDSVKADLRSFFNRQDFWEVKCWFQDSPSTDFYRFHLSINNDVITSNIRNWIVTDDRFFNGQYIGGAPIDYLEREKIALGDTINVELFTISREYYNFIENAKSELRGSNPLFSGPGANIRGNISNEAIGFFTAYPVSRVKFLVP
jgi:hypothetical protein